MSAEVLFEVFFNLLCYLFDSINVARTIVCCDYFRILYVFVEGWEDFLAKGMLIVEIIISIHATERYAVQGVYDGNRA